jgi:hypothetical protein
MAAALMVAVPRASVTVAVVVTAVVVMAAAAEVVVAAAGAAAAEHLAAVVTAALDECRKQSAPEAAIGGCNWCGVREPRIYSRDPVTAPDERKPERKRSLRLP